MKKLFVLPLFLFAFQPLWAATPFSTFQTAITCYPSLHGQTGWWPGNGNPDDVIAGHDAILHDDATFGPGLVGQAFVLDGDGDFADVPYDPALNLGTADFTVALWANFDSTAGEQVLVEKWVQRSSTSLSPSEGWTLTKLEDNVLRLAMSAGTDADTNVDSAPLTIPIDTWIHFAATRLDGQVTLYMNGEPVASGTYTDSLDSTALLKFGHRGNPSDTPGSEDEYGFFLNGRMDEVQIFAGQALSQESIQSIFDAGSLGSCSTSVTGGNPNIIASISGDWFWTSGFNPGILDIWIYESAAGDAALLWQGSREANDSGFIHVFYEDHGQDLVPGNYLVVSDGVVEKGLVLEQITMEVFDIENEIMAGTAPAGREVVVVAGMAEAETQGVIWVTADPVSGAWSADFKTIGFDITEPMRTWSFAQIHDADGDANEAGTPAPLPPAHPLAPSSTPIASLTTTELLYPNMKGAFIELTAEPLRPLLWTVVQWYDDARGFWLNVDGWQGTFNTENGRVTWYVGPEHLGEGLFRWVVYEIERGKQIASSEPFSLPSRNGEVLQVMVSLLPSPFEEPSNLSTDVYDDFNNPAYDGSYNPTLWPIAFGCEDAAQSNGIIVFQSNCDMLVGESAVPIDQIGVFEARVKVGSDFQGDAATQELVISTYELPTGPWWAFCGIIADSTGVKRFFHVLNVGLDEWNLQQTMAAEYDRWYTIRFEVDSDTMTFRCYVDGQLVGTVIPKDAELLREVNFIRVLEAARNPDSFATTYADEVRVSYSGG